MKLRHSKRAGSLKPPANVCSYCKINNLWSHAQWKTCGYFTCMKSKFSPNTKFGYRDIPAFEDGVRVKAFYVHIF